jgi:hypothetical protein
LDNSSLNVVPTETLSKMASTATLANRFCSVKGIPNFSKVSKIVGSTSSILLCFIVFFGAE